MRYNIGIIGLGYVGLPLAVEFGQKYKTTGFDINTKRVSELKQGVDSTLEIESGYLTATLNTGLFNVTSNLQDLADCNIYIITVPTPIDKNKRPDLSPLLKASEFVGSNIRKGDIVIYESTVYPGVTENECVPVIEKTSKLIFNQDFFVGYSPERINPGDKEHTLTKILKITSGSTTEAGDIIDNLYKSIITAGTYKASSIMVAEAAKVIENSQRDINIAFVNELSKIFNLLHVDTQEVLAAAGTKWNFLNFKPGLVGGHCIGVDPYYLAQKAQEVGYHPEIILAGRRVNDSMGNFIASEVIKLMLKKNLKIAGSRILILGFTFKENCPDIRNTRVIDIHNELRSYQVHIDIYDPWVNPEEVRHEYGIDILAKENVPDFSKYQAVILAVAHQAFRGLNIQASDASVVYDVKGVLAKHQIDSRL